MRRVCFAVLAVVMAVVLPSPAAVGRLQPVAAGPATHGATSRVFLPVVPRSPLMQASDVEFEFSQVVQPGQDARLLAVAFHAIRFIDVSGTDLGELAFGSTAANAVQGDGWYGNEQWPDVGSFQWAGGVGRRARMRLAIPPGTEGLLLHVASVTDEQWMTVRVNGTATARVRVDAYWHHSYVPVDAADCPCGPDAEL